MGPNNVEYLDKFTSRKVKYEKSIILKTSDSLREWVECYVRFALIGIRSEEVVKKIILHLERFCSFFENAYGHDRISACLKRDVVAWQRTLQQQNLAAVTVNNHLASLSAFTSWVVAQNPEAFALGDPAKGIGELALPPLEPRSLTDDQVRSLKNICDRLERFHQLKGRRSAAAVRANARPWRDRAIVFVLLSTGLRREELVNLNLEQVSPCTAEELRTARRCRISEVLGKGKTERVLFLSLDARLALADYLEKERPQDVTPNSSALFLAAKGIPARKEDGRLSPTSINQILNQIGRWHDAEIKDPERHICPLRPHDLRHTFAFQLSKATSNDAYELERRLGHRSQRYIHRYTNPPESIAAEYVEEF